MMLHKGVDKGTIIKGAKFQNSAILSDPFSPTLPVGHKELKIQ